MPTPIISPSVRKKPPVVSSIASSRNPADGNGNGHSAEACLRLTSLASSAGCAAKLGQSLLGQIVGGLESFRDSKVLVDQSTADDAGVYRISSQCALVQSANFFPPIVDDPETYGQIAAANALSDVYAMGGRPLTALNLLGIPTDRVELSVARAILRGGAAKLREASCSLLGGHTIRTAEPIYGVAVTGTVHPRRILTHSGARAGDLLVLTKPLGTGIATAAMKRGLAGPQLVQRALASMRTLNTLGAEIGERQLARAATDITGFGLLGHLAGMCRASRVSAELEARSIPALDQQVMTLIAQECIPSATRSNLTAAQEVVRWRDVDALRAILLADTQTSGGLLLSVSPRKLAAALDLLKMRHALSAAVIGRIVPGARSSIVVRA